MNNYIPLFRDMNLGQPIYALIKGDTILYFEGKVVSVSPLRMEMLKDIVVPKNVIDFTYEINNNTYTDVINVTDSMFSTNKPGAITLVATSKDIVLREVKASLKLDEDFMETIDQTINKKKNNIEQYKSLILKLDTDWAQQLAIESRITSLENNSKETNTLLKSILEKLG